MALPFPTRPLPTLVPKPGSGQVPNKQPAAKAPMFGYSIRRPSVVPSPPKKPVIEYKPGFLEKGGFRKHDELVHEVKKDSYYKSIPTYGKKLTQAERIKLVTELERAGRGAGGLTGQKFGMAIKNLGKEKMRALSHREFGKAKLLDQKIKQAQAWKKVWDRQIVKKINGRSF